MKKQIQFRLEESQIEQAKSLLSKYETITDFVREAIEKEIQNRTTQNKKEMVENDITTI